MPRSLFSALRSRKPLASRHVGALGSWLRSKARQFREVFGECEELSLCAIAASSDDPVLMRAVAVTIVTREAEWLQPVVERGDAVYGLNVQSGGER